MERFILVTGASGGIGSAICMKLAEEGYSLYLHYNQNEGSVKRLLSKLSRYGGEYIPIQADLSVDNGYKKIASNIFSIDGIVHCCGIAHYGLLTELKEETLDKLINTHLRSPLLLTKELLPKLIKKRKGNIIVISSIWGETGAALEVAYSAVKGAQISFVKALGKELAMDGIRVNGVAPGAINTPMMGRFSEEDLRDLENEIPMGKLGTPDNVADVVSFLLSEKSSYITGQMISVNGGWHT